MTCTLIPKETHCHHPFTVALHLLHEIPWQPLLSARQGLPATGSDFRRLLPRQPSSLTRTHHHSRHHHPAANTTTGSNTAANRQHKAAGGGSQRRQQAKKKTTRWDLPLYLERLPASSSAFSDLFHSDKDFHPATEHLRPFTSPVAPLSGSRFPCCVFPFPSFARHWIQGRLGFDHRNASKGGDGLTVVVG